MEGWARHRWPSIAVTAVLVVVVVAFAAGTSDRAVVTGAPIASEPPLDPAAGSPEPAIDVAVQRSWTALPAAEREAQLTLVVGGDLLIHSAVWRSATDHAGGGGYDFAPMFDDVRPFVADADLALCHLEVPLSADNAHVASFPVFSAPYELADAIASAGFDGCSVASNHTLDQGPAGVDATLGHLDRVGLGHTGAARSAEEGQAIRVYEVRGRRIAHLSYTYGFNGFRVPAEEPWRADLIDVGRIDGDVLRARGEGADLVLVSLHFGTEYDARPSAYQRDIVTALERSGQIDLVIGHHAHVVQPVAVVGSLPVIYGLGNLLSNMTQPERRDGVLVRVRFDHVPGERATVGAIDALPTQVDRVGHVIRVADPSSWERTMAVLNAGGVEVPAVVLPSVDP